RYGKSGGHEPGKQRNLPTIEQSGELVATEAIAAQEEESGRSVDAEEVPPGMKGPQESVAVSDGEESNGGRPGAIRCVFAQAVLGRFECVNKGPEMKFALTVDKMDPRRWSIRVEPLLGGKAIRRDKPGEQNQEVNGQQKPHGPGKGKAPRHDCTLIRGSNA